MITLKEHNAHTIEDINELCHMIDREKRCAGTLCENCPLTHCLSYLFTITEQIRKEEDIEYTERKCTQK